jgi:hypothetical protein
MKDEPIFFRPPTGRYVAGSGEENGEEKGMSQERRCRACKAPIPPNPGRGRPRKFCTTCVPPVPGAVGSAAWRAVNPDRVSAYNESRRKWK